MSSEKVEPWEKVGSEQLGDYRVFFVRGNRCRSPRTGEEHTFYVIESSDWTNIIPITPEGKIVFVKQYRHGTEDITLEVPGGMVDPGDPSPEVAARREMVEETGYDTSEIISLGAVAPNPAIQSNRCHTYLALDVQPNGVQRLDTTEEIELAFVDPADVPELVVRGQITHSLVVAAFYLFDHYRRAHPEVISAS